MDFFKNSIDHGKHVLKQKKILNLKYNNLLY